ncbi:RidA family protein [Pantoea ananatis]|jgi:enamine deaminase RidA (YjgF/YER057c/UK114 family)|uniref:RidA family protein n=1 Tax=Pantoea ananas TaxID=553 RepID=UPI0003629311|nr:RidA family protein [Pantoea ananatis]ASN15225.1 RidA family protein [Pantoea ananatis]MDQ1225900.1 2-iminobutanoate/2-iminopropanoate deaminase [Pantoea ananatis]MDR6089194.1 2-iminobutanoate/2-iminopropanoate deaminase [Pantoea ananatis]NCU08835.1 RidA family protein [Pantoea ananatis]PQK77864.1 RidA family protein [Pantoea ananatis]
MQPLIHTRDIQDTPHPGHYSHYALGSGLMFISGLLPVTPAGEMRSTASFAEQTSQVLANLEACLQQEGLNKHHLVMVRVYLVDVGLWAEFNRLYAQWLGEWKPARAIVPVPELHYGVLLEVEATAATGR